MCPPLAELRGQKKKKRWCNLSTFLWWSLWASFGLELHRLLWSNEYQHRPTAQSQHRLQSLPITIFTTQQYSLSLTTVE